MNQLIGKDCKKDGLNRLRIFPESRINKNIINKYNEIKFNISE